MNTAIVTGSEIAKHFAREGCKAVGFENGLCQYI